METGVRVPKQLQCTHTLCLGCLRELHHRHGNRIRCPECRKVCPVGANEVEVTPTNRFVLELLEVLDVAEFPQTIVKCEVHNKNCVKFCVEPPCGRAVCRRCVEDDHKEHHVIEIREKVKDVQYLKDVRKSVEKEVNELRKLLEEAKQQKKHIAQAKVTSEAEVDSRVQTLIDEIRKEAEEMKKKIKAQAEEETQKVDRTKKEAKECTKAGEELVEELSHLPDTTLREHAAALSALLQKRVRFQTSVAEVQETSMRCEVLRLEPQTKRQDDVIGTLRRETVPRGGAPPSSSSSEESSDDDEASRDPEFEKELNDSIERFCAGLTRHLTALPRQVVKSSFFTPR